MKYWVCAIVFVGGGRDDGSRSSRRAEVASKFAFFSSIRIFSIFFIFLVSQSHSFALLSSHHDDPNPNLNLNP